VAASVVNHKIPHKGDVELFYSPENIESVCKSCHDGPIQSEERRGYSSEVGTDGWPIDYRHPAIEG
jgi:5-methylcytosine-specific restriction protein A